MRCSVRSATRACASTRRRSALAAVAVRAACKPEEAGELVAAEGLSAPTEAKLVRMGKNGKPATDGVFAESKEYLAGFWIIDVDSAKTAYERAAEASTAPLPPDIVLEIEVREVMTMSQHEGCGSL